jgi:hypothetical protein
MFVFVAFFRVCSLLRRELRFPPDGRGEASFMIERGAEHFPYRKNRPSGHLIRLW